MLGLFPPRRLVLQWHITERCNWRCKHCYADDSIDELPVDQLYKIFLQFIQLIDILKLRKGDVRLSIAGGEPMLRKDFFLFLEKIYKFNNRFMLGILTNGSFINDKNAKRLKSLGVSYIQLSLEGLEDINDEIRGKGSFKKIIKSMKILLEHRIDTQISLTLTKKNLKDVPGLTELCGRLGIKRFAARRHVPIGRGAQLKKYLLEPLEQKDYYLWREKQRVEAGFNNSDMLLAPGCEDGIGKFEILYNRGFSISSAYPSSTVPCGIIEGRILSLFPNGDVLACRRLPIKVGNALKENLVDIYFFSDILWRLRNLNNLSDTCKKCRVFRSCLGGAKCITYAYFNKLSAPDPQCWRVFKRLPPQRLFSKIKDKRSQKISLTPEKIQNSLRVHL